MRATGLGIGGPPGEGAVQVHHMQPGEALLGEGGGLGAGVLGIDRGLCHLAALEAHHLPALEVDGRIKRECAARPIHAGRLRLAAIGRVIARPIHAIRLRLAAIGRDVHESMVPRAAWVERPCGDSMTRK
jgi:hypothetical protein